MFKILCSSFLLIFYFGSIKSQEIQCRPLDLDPLRVINSAYTLMTVTGEIDLEVIPDYAQFLSDKGILNVIISGYIGEGSSLNLCDRIALIRAWVDAAGPLGIKLIVQIGLLPFVDTLTLARLCLDLNVSAILVLPEIILSAQNVEEAVADLLKIQEAAPGLTIILEDIIQVNSNLNFVDLTLLAKERLACPLGVLTSMNNALQIQASTSIADIYIAISGYDAITATLLSPFNATANSIVNLFPDEVLEIVATIAADDTETAQLLGLDLSIKVNTVLNLGSFGLLNQESRDFIVFQKVTFSFRSGIGTAIPRLPLVPATLEQVNQILNALTGLGATIVGTVEQVLGTAL